MCRFVAYISHEKQVIDTLINKPENSLVKQSHGAKEGLHGINADGFGLAWYNHELSDEPGVFKSIQPAWNDRNLSNLSKKIESACFLGHIRASTVGDVTLYNCHPFTYKQYSMVHNGTMHGFKKFRRELLAELSDELFFEVKGQTDSECLFFLIMQYVDKGMSLEGAIKGAFTWVLARQKEFPESEFSRLNVVITDGKEMIATRFVSKDHDSLSLNYSLVQEGEEIKSVLVASEPLDEQEGLWMVIPENHYLKVEPKTLAAEILAF